MWLTLALRPIESSPCAVVCPDWSRGSVGGRVTAAKSNGLSLAVAYYGDFTADVMELDGR